MKKTPNLTYADIGRLEVGTETLVDKSKSVKSVLMKLFEGELFTKRAPAMPSSSFCSSKDGFYTRFGLAFSDSRHMKVIHLLNEKELLPYPKLK